MKRVLWWVWHLGTEHYQKDTEVTGSEIRSGMRVWNVRCVKCGREFVELWPRKRMAEAEQAGLEYLQDLLDGKDLLEEKEG